MAIILNIDTSLENASIALAIDAENVHFNSNNQQRDHASWLHITIGTIMKQCNLRMEELEAVGVTIGPGSYTGLRVGLSAAKGLCFALKIPLITIGTLDLMAWAVRDQVSGLNCPLIDARRMEVFTAIYYQNFSKKKEPTAMIIDAQSFHEELDNNQILFSGNGIEKLKPILQHQNASYSDRKITAEDMSTISADYFVKKQFADLAYTEPFYLKEFYDGSK